MNKHMARILLVEDSEDLGILLKNGLQSYFEIVQASSLNEAWGLLKKQSFDLFLIDVMLPDGSGFDLCAKLSEDLNLKETPKFILSGKVETEDKVYGFSCGADDYITKPFHIIELKARIERSLNRTQSPQNDSYNFGDLEFVVDFQRCYVNDNATKKDLGLTPTEFRLFLALVKNEGKALSRQEIEKAIWEDHGTVIELRGIDTHIAHLRKKLGPMKDLIVSVYGTGYSYCPKKAA